MLKRMIAAALIAVGGLASGQIVSASFDVLDGADAGAPTPAGVIVIDGFVDVENIPGSAWTAAGIRVVTSNGATLRYQWIPGRGDPNFNPDYVNLINTGAHNDRFVTTLSRPRIRNETARFNNCGAATAGEYDPAGPNPSTTDPTEFNCAFFASPPMVSGTVGTDGYVVRIALDIPGITANQVVLGGPTAPPGAPILLATIAGFDDGTPAPGWVNTTYNSPTPVGGNSYLWGVIPEPAALALLAIGVLRFRRR